MDALFDSDEVFIAKPRPNLPPPVERAKLREKLKLTPWQVADACGITEETLLAWEEGTSAPLGGEAATYGYLLAVLQAHLTGEPTQWPVPALLPDWAALGRLKHELTAAMTGEEPCRRCHEPTAQRVGGRPQHLGTRCPAPGVPRPYASVAASAAPPQRQPAPSDSLPAPRAAQPASPPRHLHYPAARGRRYGDGPLAVLASDTTGLLAHLADGRVRPCPARDLPGLLEWTLHAPLGAAPIRAEGLPSGPLLVLTSTALDRLGLPVEAPDQAHRHPRSDHILLRQLRSIGWQSDDHGLGPWMRLHPTTGDPACESIHLAITTWGALHQDAWQLPDDLSPTQLAAAIGQYANLVRTPTGAPGTCGHRLMSDLRPPEHRHTVTRALVARGVPSALTTRADPAPCEAPPGHQLAGEDTLADTDIDWWRPPTPEEATRPHVVCFAVNLHHFADSNNIRVSDAPAKYIHYPAFDPKTPGSWLVDLSENNPHPLLPPAFASNGLAWHTTPALAYATRRGIRPQPVRAWLRLKKSNPYLDPWYERVRKARLAVLQSLGLTSDLDTPDLLTALGDLPRADPVQRALLNALDATAQDAFTILDQPPAQPDQALLNNWTTPDDPTWRPDLRAAVTANARANVHRKLSRTARDGNIPLAVADGHLLYATHTPDLTEITEAPSCEFRIGLSPGKIRPVAVRPMDWYQAQCTDHTNAARTLKNSCASW
ncbi:helix-turn-helix domain-containing protein [Streptomyces sp. NPDC057718]|uniref:helix-turn-helix domain-containing protein n=1 Tax=Streptomyces sp. NPDC057718 TaxID=3346225 RepID=UPI0036B2A021